jgi:hypothetical protein
MCRLEQIKNFVQRVALFIHLVRNPVEGIPGGIGRASTIQAG